MVDKCPTHNRDLSPYTGPGGKTYFRCLSCVALKQQLRQFRKLTPEQLDEQERKTRQSYRRNMEAIAMIRKEWG